MRHKRRKELSERERTAAVEAAAKLHRHLRIDMTNLQPGSADYLALSALSDSVNRSIRELTGSDPEWMRVGPATYKGVNG